jgi:hypothetical protein
VEKSLESVTNSRDSEIGAGTSKRPNKLASQPTGKWYEGGETFEFQGERKDSTKGTAVGLGPKFLSQSIGQSFQVLG